MKTKSLNQKRGLIVRILIALLALVLIVNAGTWIAGASAKAKLMRENPTPGQLVDVGGFKMHVNCTGKGSPTVILVSGLDDFSIAWSRVQPEIAKSTRVCCMTAQAWVGARRVRLRARAKIWSRNCIPFWSKQTSRLPT
jgi:hypothetical protein